MTPVLYLLGVAVFVVGLVASVGLHELGHLVPAKRFGVKVTQYFVGFGRTVWSTRRGETEYGLKAIPLGGYVKLVGMLPPDPRDPEGDRHVRSSNTGLFTQLVSDARAAEYELVKPGDEDRLFYKLPWWKKVVVMAGGPTTNLVIAFVLFAAVFGVYGTVEQTTTVGTVAQCVIPADEAGRDCRAGDPVTPAVQAGLRPGDQVLAFNGSSVSSWEDLVRLVRDNDDGPATLLVERDGERLTMATNTTVNVARTLDGGDRFEQAGFLGITSTTTRETHGLLFTAEQMGSLTWQTVQALGTLPAKVWDVAQATVGLEERDPEGPMSVVGAGRVAGEITSDETSPVADRLAFLVVLLAGFNLFVGVFNFVPLLPLDGGHIAGALYEAARRGVARLRGRPDPGFVDVAKMLPVAYAVGLVILVMGVVLIAGDIVAPISVG
jgi:membrane-associated protease RseP (regulator of RpoE activity)